MSDIEAKGANILVMYWRPVTTNTANSGTVRNGIDGWSVRVCQVAWVEYDRIGCRYVSLRILVRVWVSLVNTGDISPEIAQVNTDYRRIRTMKELGFKLFLKKRGLKIRD